MEFATIIVDYKNKRVKELIPGRTSGQLQQALAYIPGRERVKNVVCDLSKPYKSFAKEFFPNAKVIADHFHVVRLLNPAINKGRKDITGDKRNLRVRKLLLMNSKKLDYWTRSELQKWLKKHPKLEQLYYAKETLHKLYRCKGFGWARKVMTKLLDTLALSKYKELQSLRRTLREWQEEILNYFENRITNARTEGYNNVCKQLQKRAYGYRSFKNYRLKVLYACQ
jgi:transposase